MQDGHKRQEMDDFIDKQTCERQPLDLRVLLSRFDVFLFEGLQWRGGGVNGGDGWRRGTLTGFEVEGEIRCVLGFLDFLQ